LREDIKDWNTIIAVGAFGYEFVDQHGIAVSRDREDEIKVDECIITQVGDGGSPPTSCIRIVNVPQEDEEAVELMIIMVEFSKQENKWTEVVGPPMGSIAVYLAAVPTVDKLREDIKDCGCPMKFSPYEFVDKKGIRLPRDRENRKKVSDCIIARDEDDRSPATSCIRIVDVQKKDIVDDIKIVIHEEAEELSPTTDGYEGVTEKLYTFGVANSPNSESYSYQWDFGDGKGPSVTSFDTRQYKYDNSGMKSVKLSAISSTQENFKIEVLFHIKDPIRIKIDFCCEKYWKNWCVGGLFAVVTLLIGILVALDKLGWL